MMPPLIPAEIGMHLRGQPQPVAGHARSQMLHGRRPEASPAGAQGRLDPVLVDWPTPGRSCAIQRPSPETRIKPPTTRNAGLVTTPRASRARPSASTSGATVGRGIDTESGSAGASQFAISWGSLDIRCRPRMAYRLPAEQVDHREDHHPDGVHEVPVPRDQLDAEPVRTGHMPRRGRGPARSTS